MALITVKRPPVYLPDGVLIKLTHGLETVIDTKDADLAKFNWCASVNNDSPLIWHVVRTVWADGAGRTIRLHRVIADRMGISGMVDHKDRDTLNNRRSNLRAATHAQNSQNQKLNRNNTSGAKGVFFRYGRWHAYIQANKRIYRLGKFNTREEAAAAYAEASKIYHGEYANPVCTQEER